MQQPQAGLEIKASFSILFFMLYLFPPKISIDGSQAMPGKWGDNLIPMSPGRHMVSFWWPLYWIIPANRAQVVVDIAPGQVAQLQYKPRWFWFLEGKMQQVGVRPMLAGGQAQIPQGGDQPAGWHPDPAGRHEMRYWSGAAWTDDVSDAGVSTKDPMG
ncbi:MAG: hypothetical protein QOI95_1931 [Acidimicrobiaceae bacterium]